MSYSDEQLKKKLYDIVFAINGGTVIWANQGKPAPNGSYLTLWLGPIMHIGNDELDLIEEKLTTVGVREMMLSVNSYGLNPGAALRKLINRLQWPVYIDMLYAGDVKLVYVKPSDIRSIPELTDAKFSDRCQVDLTIRFTENDSDDTTELIETVELTNEIDDSQTIINPQPEEP